MLRTVFRNLTIKQNVCNGLSISRALCTERPLEELVKDHNVVKITGTIITPAKDLANDNKSIIVRTNEDTDKYYNHHVNLLKTDEPLTIGDRIYVFGLLSSKPFTLDDGRVRQRFIIKCVYHRLRGHTDSRSSFDVQDQNTVKIVGKISSDVRRTDKHVLFTIACNHTPKVATGLGGMVITQFYRIIVSDHLVQDQAAKLQKFDKVLVDGKINYMSFKNANGKTQHGGFITPFSIKRIDERSSSTRPSRKATKI